MKTHNIKNNSNHIACWVYLSWRWICATFHPFTTDSITTYAIPIFNIHLKYSTSRAIRILRKVPLPFFRILSIVNILENCFSIERKTGFEPATFSLEGWRSTNWVTSAYFFPTLSKTYDSNRHLFHHFHNTKITKIFETSKLFCNFFAKIIIIFFLQALSDSNSSLWFWRPTCYHWHQEPIYCTDSRTWTCDFEDMNLVF